MLKRLSLIAVLAGLAIAASPPDAAAQVRRVPARRVVIVPTYVAPLGFYDPWFGFYDYQWGYPPYGPYGPYRRYNIAPDSSVRLEVKPRQAEVFVDGYYAGIVDDFDGTFQRLHLPPGEHEITLYLEGYRSVQRHVYLTPDNTFKIRLDMDKLGPGEQPDARPQPTAPPGDGPGSPSPAYPPPPPRGQAGRRPPPPQGPPPPQARSPRGEASAYGSLAIRVQPADADVMIDGEKWSAPENQEPLVVDMPEGRHTIQVQKAGYRTYITDVDVRRGETTALNVSLRSQ